MIILTFNIRIRPDDFRELVHTLKSMAKKIQELEGCKSCRCYQSINAKNQLFFINQWSCRKYLDAHIQSELFSALKGTFQVLAENYSMGITVPEHHKAHVLQPKDKSVPKGVKRLF